MIFEVMINAWFYGVEFFYITSLLFFHWFISHFVNFIVIRRLFNFSSIREKLVRFHSCRIHTHIINFLHMIIYFLFFFDCLYWNIWKLLFVSMYTFLDHFQFDFFSLFICWFTILRIITELNDAHNFRRHFTFYLQIDNFVCIYKEIWTRKK